MFPLEEQVTIWNKTSNDGFGGATWSTPVVMAAKRSFKQEQFRDENGDIRMSKSLIYTNGVGITVGTMVLMGSHADVSPPATADEVKAYSAVASETTMKKIWL